jgi:hypothetical protein
MQGGRDVVNYRNYSIILVSLLDEFNLVSFWRVNECKNRAAAGGGGPV